MGNSNEQDIEIKSEDRIVKNCVQNNAESKCKARIVIKTSQETVDSDSGGTGTKAAVSNAKEQEQMEVTAFCKYYRKCGRHYVFYDEIIEGTDRVTSNRIIFSDERMELVRKGAVNTVMSFEEGRIIREKYHTQYGIMEMGVDTQRLTVSEKENGLEVEADYLLEINGEYVSANKISLRIIEGK